MNRYELRDTPPLSESDFNSLRLIMTMNSEGFVAVGYWATLTYDQYKVIRPVLIEAGSSSNLGACCMSDPSHRVLTIWTGREVSITEDALTGDIVEADCSGDNDTKCEKGCPTDYTSNWEEYECLLLRAGAK